MGADSQEKLIDDEGRIDAEIQRFYDALDAITATADPEPEAVAEFARTPETRQALDGVLPPDELAALDPNLELYEALADFDLTSDDPELTPTEKLRIVIETWQAGRATDKRQNAKHGHTSQVFDEWDAHRAGAGKDEYNAKRGKKRELKAMEEGRPFQKRAPRGSVTPERVREQGNSRQHTLRVKERAEAKALGISYKEYKRRKSDAKAGAQF